MDHHYHPCECVCAGCAWRLKSRIESQVKDEVPWHVERCIDGKLSKHMQQFLASDTRVQKLVDSVSDSVMEQVGTAAQTRVDNVLATSADSIRLDIHQDAARKFDTFVHEQSAGMADLNQRVKALEQDKTPLWTGLAGMTMGGCLAYAAQVWGKK